MPLRIYKVMGLSRGAWVTMEGFKEEHRRQVWLGEDEMLQEFQAWGAKIGASRDEANLGSSQGPWIKKSCPSFFWHLPC